MMRSTLLKPVVRFGLLSLIAAALAGLAGAGFSSAKATVVPTCLGVPVTIFAFGPGPTFGGPGVDVILGDNTANTIFGLGDNDLICGQGGDDVLNGNAGSDTILGQDGDDSLYGEIGEDSLFGGPGNDYHNGGLGPDSCNGGAGANIFVAC